MKNSPWLRFYHLKFHFFQKIGKNSLFFLQKILFYLSKCWKIVALDAPKLPQKLLFSKLTSRVCQIVCDLVCLRTRIHQKLFFLGVVQCVIILQCGQTILRNLRKVLEVNSSFFRIPDAQNVFLAFYWSLSESWNFL